MYWERFFREHEQLHKAISVEIATRRIMNNEVQYPPDNMIYRAFDLTEKTESVKVIIVGQDPYHGEGEANGLSFAVNKGIKLPPSLQNIYKELKNDLGIDIAKHGDLTSWANQGVLLLNSCLTVAENKPSSHFDIGWELLTDEVIKLLSDEGKKVFILWGNKAQSKEGLINPETNYIIKSPHPSPFAANKGFFGSKPFSKTNEYLKSIGETQINWEVK